MSRRIILCLLFCIVLLYCCCIVVLFPKRSYHSSRCLAICFRVMSESRRSCQGDVWFMSGSSQSNVRVRSFQGHVRVMSGSCLGFVRVISGSCMGYIRVLTGSCQLGLIGIVQFTCRLETEGFLVLFKNVPLVIFYFFFFFEHLRLFFISILPF